MNHLNKVNYKKLVDSAISLFNKYGYNNVSVNQICQAAGIARSSFYASYSGKDDLILHIYSDEFVDDRSLINRFVSTENDFERIWIFYSYYVKLAMKVGPVVSSSLMIIELNKNAGVYDRMQEVRKWTVPLCANCQKLGIIRNTAKPDDLISFVSACLNNLVFEWCRTQRGFDVYKKARNAVETILDVLPEYRKPELVNEVSDTE